MRVALVHDYLNQRGGAERVFAQIARAFPDAPIYTALFDPAATGDLIDPARVRVSWLQRIPTANRNFRYLAPLYPGVFEGFDLSGYDLVVSSTTAWAKGVRVRPNATHVCYIANVSRFAFAYESYVGEMLGGSPLGSLARPLVAALAAWDKRAALRPTAYIANSHNVARRVERAYGRRAHVIHPPIDLDRFTVGDGHGGYFLTVARLLPYKRIDVAIAACAAVGARLRVVGDGPVRAELHALARGTATEFCGQVGDAELATLMAGARAIIVPGEEDFGLVPLEANACGRPVVALGRGGVLETVVPGLTGELFEAPNADALAAALTRFEPARYDPEVLRAHAARFGSDRFVTQLRELVAQLRWRPPGFADPP
ncbi:MAG: glycosyltransferase [Vulcanimicrobiaceae bacterium]